MMLAKVSLLALLALLAFCGPAEGRADVHADIFRQIAEHPDQGILVTFAPAPVGNAYDVGEIFEFAKNGGVQCGDANAKSMFTIEEFSSTSCYNEARGVYVYGRLQEQHERTKQLMAINYPRVQVLSSIPISNSFVIIADAPDVLRMTEDDKVVEIHTNEMFRVPLENDPDSGVAQPLPSLLPKNFLRLMSDSQENSSIRWNVRKIGADAVWKMEGGRTHGEGIVYAVADTGIDYTHPNIAKNYLGLKSDGTYDHNYSWFDGVRVSLSPGKGDCGVASPHPCDDQGHGTHVTSTAVGADGFGVAPGARWMGCRNMDRGLGSPSTYLNCLNFFLAPHDLTGKNPNPSRRPHVVGNSYGCPTSEGCSKRAMASAVEALRAAGIFMSVSAGNEGPGCSTVADPPALERAAISVAATNINDGLASFSSRGPVVVGGEVYRKPDLAAPGVDIVAAYPGRRFKSLNGTSMASPHVSGAAILIFAMCPCLGRNVDKVQALLESTAIHMRPPAGSGPFCGGDRHDSVPNNYFGWGRINVLEAVNQCKIMCGDTVSTRPENTTVHHKSFSRKSAGRSAALIPPAIHMSSSRLDSFDKLF